VSKTADEFIPTRESLLCRLKNWEDAEGWKAFFDLYWKLIYRVARQAGLSDAEAQDVVQETVITVAKKIPEFRYDPSKGSFKGWLLQLTRWRVLNHIRKKHYEQDGKRLPREENLDTSLLESHPNSDFEFEQIWDNEWMKNLMETAVDRVKATVNPKHYQMFFLHVLKGMAAKEVAGRLQVKVMEVYFAKYKIGRLIKNQIKSLERGLP
jgi:RNA polymerase sigma factor (sigma-70 family)